jgi:hypothetical protein
MKPSWFRLVFAALFAFLFASPALAVTPVGLCSPEAQSIEAPPPVYPGDDSKVEGCSSTEDGLALRAPRPSDGPEPSFMPEPAPVKALPHVALPIAPAPSRLTLIFAEALNSGGRDIENYLDRPPRSAETLFSLE